MDFDRAEGTYLARKAREIRIINESLASPLALPDPRDASEATSTKFRIAGMLRSERSLEQWPMTETARRESREWQSGPFSFRFGYQRADLEVSGPVVYPIGPYVDWAQQETLYTSSGMSAIAALFVALKAGGEAPEVLLASDGYGETRELLRTLGLRIRALRREGTRTWPDSRRRVLVADSSVRSDFDVYRRFAPDDLALVVADTTCFWRTSNRLARLVEWSRASRIPLVCVRSHAKLDCLGIEYGRLGSIAFLMRQVDAPERLSAIAALAQRTADAIRLLGAAAVPAHFPSFLDYDGYMSCSAARNGAAILRTLQLMRAMQRHARAPLALTAYQHGMYFTLSPRDALEVDEVKRISAELCQALAALDLPAKHAGSFGFDFTTIEWFPDPVSRRNVVRIAAGDVPSMVVERMGHAIERWWHRRGLAAAPAEGEPSSMAAD